MHVIQQKIERPRPQSIQPTFHLLHIVVHLHTSTLPNPPVDKKKVLPRTATKTRTTTFTGNKNLKSLTVALIPCCRAQ